MTNPEVFEVSRRGIKFLGWAVVLLGLVTFGLLFSEWSARLFASAAALPVFGVTLIRSAKNVDTIIVDDRSIRFLPVGAELQFSEVKRLEVPSWADRFDTPPDALGRLIMQTNTERFRYVPGAIFQWRHRCRLEISGCDGNRILKALRQHVPE